MGKRFMQIGIILLAAVFALSGSAVAKIIPEENSNVQYFYVFGTEGDPLLGAEDNELVLMPDIMDDDAAFEVFDELKKQGVTRTWVSYTLPFLLFITIGYVLSLIVGYIMLYVITRAIF